MAIVSQFKTINDNPLDPELMKRMVAHLEAIPDDVRIDIAGRTVSLFGFLQNEVGDHAPFTLISFLFRMQALAQLRDQDGSPTWNQMIHRRWDLIHAAMIETAAVMPVLDDQGAPGFERDSFVEAVLRRVAPHGLS